MRIFLESQEGPPEPLIIILCFCQKDAIQIIH